MTAARAGAPGQVVSIQYLRAVAALMVFAFHAAFRVGRTESFFIGAAGVDVFFVISGFVMWTITARREPSPGVFIWHRLSRIVPLYWLVTMVYVAIGLVAPALFPYPRVVASEVVQSLLFIPFYSQTGLVEPIVAPGWTLNIEMFFYAVFAVGLALPARWRLVYLTAVLCAMAAMGAMLPSDAPAPLKAYGNQLLLEFLAGVYLGRLWSSGWAPGFAVGLLLIAAGVGGFAAVQLTGFSPAPLRFLLWGGPSVCLVLGALAVERSGRLPEIPLLHTLGDASYSIYLLHTLMLAVVYKFVGDRYWLLFLTTLPLLCIGSVICYRVFERPVERRLRQAGGMFTSAVRAQFRA